MHIKHIHDMVEKLSECAKCEMDKGIECIDTKEMGEVAEIIKELCEAEYYAIISKAMDESEYGEDYDEYGPKQQRYYRGQPRDSMDRYMKRRGYESMPYFHMQPERYDHTEQMRDMDLSNGRMYYPEMAKTGSMEHMRDSREGKAGMMRKSYMETKELNRGNTTEEKQKKMKELEAYMTELGGDITEMVAGASQEEKTLLKTKLQTLAQKIL